MKPMKPTTAQVVLDWIDRNRSDVLFWTLAAGIAVLRIYQFLQGRP